MIKPATQVRSEMTQDRQYQSELARYVTHVSDRIALAQSKGYTRCCFAVGAKYEDELRRMFLEKGYTFRPTGYYGGVWQMSEDICW